MKESVSTTIKNVARAIRRFFMGEAYTVAACVPGYGTFTGTINAPDKRRALEEAEAIADPGFVLSCELAAR